MTLNPRKIMAYLRERVRLYRWKLAMDRAKRISRGP